MQSVRTLAGERASGLAHDAVRTQRGHTDDRRRHGHRGHGRNVRQLHRRRSVHATTGHRLWFDAGFQATEPLTASDGLVFLNGGYFIAILNSSTGATITDLFSPGGSNFTGSVVPAEGRLYVCTLNPSTFARTLVAYQP